MTRVVVLGLVLLLLACPSASIAQQTTTAAASAELPNFGSRIAPGEAVVDLADFVAGNLDATGTLPDLAQVRTAEGRLRTITAAEAFVLLARTVYLWRDTGELSETVPITPDQINAPVLDLEDVAAAPQDPSVGRTVPTEQFLAQCQAVVQWADRLQVIPTAVWVDGQRLSAADYLAGMAICVSYAYWEGQLSDNIFLPNYAPPPSWVGEAASVSAQAPSESAGQETSDAEPTYAAPETGVSATDQATGSSDEYGSSEEYDEGGLASAGDQPGVGETGAAGQSGASAQEDGSSGEYAPGSDGGESPEPGEPQAPPRLVLTPEPGDTVSGVVDIVASYSGPPAKFVIFTFDGNSQAIMNSPPFSSRWNTSDLKPGPHQVRIQVLGDGESVLIDQTSAYMVNPPPPKKSPGSVSGA